MLFRSLRKGAPNPPGEGSVPKFLQVIALNSLHRFAVDDEQILHRADLEHLFVERSGTGRGFAPDCRHAERVRKLGEAVKDASAFPPAASIERTTSLAFAGDAL